MSTSTTGNKTHDDAVARAESKVQAVLVAVNPTTYTVSNPPPTQAAVNTALAAFHVAVLASAVTNGINPTMTRFALMELGQPPK